MALAAAAGVLQTASFAPFGWWWLQVASIALLAATCQGARPRQAAALGWVFGFGWLASGFWWLFNSLHRYGGMPAWLSVLAVGLLAAGLALYYAAAAAAWARWVQPAAGVATAPGRSAWGWACAWTLAELARGSFFTGFPWIAGGYAHTDGVLAAWAPWLGVYGLGLLGAWLGAALGFGVLKAWASKKALDTVGVVLLPLLVIDLGLWLPHDFTRPTGTLSVTLLQPDVAQDSKFDVANIEHALRWHAQELAAARGQLVVSPESSLPLLAQQIDAATWQNYARPFEVPGAGRGALLGVFTGNDEQGYTNSVVGLSAASGGDPGRFYVYGKRHLLPFGEFVPPGFGWFVALLNIPIGDQAHGHSTAPFHVAGQRVRPLICYEDLFGEELAGSLAGPQAATVLVNVSNLAWFGPLMMQDQDLQFSRMRALEFQRPMVRSTNTGATAAIDAQGRVIARLPSETEGRLDTQVEGRVGETPYARWVGWCGLWPLWALGLLGLWVVRRRRP